MNSDGLSDAKTSVNGTKLSRDRLAAFLSICAICIVTARAVLTNGHTGHVPRAPGFFFLFEAPRTGCGEINFLKLIAVNCLCNTK